MKNYKVQMMTKEEYNEYMSGAMFCGFDEEIISAETAEEAVAIAQAKYPNLIINQYPKSLEEIAEQEAAYEAKRKAEEEKKVAAKARKIARDLANGITPEKRKAMDSLRRHELNVKDILNKIEELKAELAIEKKIIAKKQKAIAEM